MQPIAINEAFLCAHCNRDVPKSPQGYRNHCPYCLYSLHVDGDIPGDRASSCHGLMRPIGCTYNSQKSHQLILVCETCGKQHRNILSEDDNMELVAQLILLENTRLSEQGRRKRTK